MLVNSPEPLPETGLELFLVWFRQTCRKREDFASGLRDGAGAAEERRAEMKAEAVRCLAASQDAELFVNGGMGGRRNPSLALRDRNDFACFGHARV
jgi:hypothetical protein